jgi:fused signal recognition particle receptor
VSGPPSFRERFLKGLERTRDILNADVMDLARGQRPLDPKDLEAIEEALIAADLGLPAVQDAMDVLRQRSSQLWTQGPPAMRAVLREEVRKAVDRTSDVRPFSARPWVVFVVGVNGVGKTTTIAKLAQAWKADGRTTLLCAADTFRAAAAEQLEIWARRVGAPFHRGAEGADPSAVLTDGLRAALSRGYDAVLVDTAGRLHTKDHLMAELSKVRRVIDREAADWQKRTILVLDATTGQNALAQARTFSQVVPIDGVLLAKLDGTAKGGMVVAIARELKLPVLYLGVGEKAEDLVDFRPREFASALVG